jgi:hypothetical protein
MPTGEKCPKCGKYLINVNGTIKCSDKGCSYTKDAKS